jgi:hypothetical protein
MRMVDKIPSTEEVLAFPGDGGDTGKKLAAVPRQQEMFTFKQAKVAELKTKVKATVDVEVGRVLSRDKEYPFFGTFVVAQDRVTYGEVSSGEQILRLIGVKFIDDDLPDIELDGLIAVLTKLRDSRS